MIEQIIILGKRGRACSVNRSVYIIPPVLCIRGVYYYIVYTIPYLYFCRILTLTLTQLFQLHANAENFIRWNILYGKGSSSSALPVCVCNARSGCIYTMRQLSVKETDQILTEKAVFVSVNNNNSNNIQRLMSKRDTHFVSGRSQVFVMATPCKYIIH